MNKNKQYVFTGIILMFLAAVSYVCDAPTSEAITVIPKDYVGLQLFCSFGFAIGTIFFVYGLPIDDTIVYRQ